MSANNLYRGLFELLTLPHGGDGLLAAPGNRRELLSVARMEGCLPELYARWAAASLLSPSESQEHEQIARRRASVAEVLQALPRGSLVANAGGARRGAAALEVLIPDFAAIAPLHEAVGRFGYRLQGAGEWLVPLRGAMHSGVATFRYARTGAAQGAVAIDVQVGGVALDARRHLPFADLAEGGARLDGGLCRTLEPTREVLRRIAGFGAGTEPVTVRQIADLHLLLKASGSRIDFAWLQVQVERHEAWAGLRQLREAIAAKRLGALLSWGLFGRLIDAAVTRGEVAAAPRTRKPRIAALARSVFDALPLARDNDIAARLARAPWLVSRVLQAGYRVHGVPVSTRPFDAPRFMRIDGALYLATGAGLMLLSLVDLHDGARAALGERVRTGSRPVVLARWSAGKPRTR